MIARTERGRKAFSFVADRSFAQNRLHTMTKKTVIDEELVRRAIGNTPSILDADPPPFDERIIKTVEDSGEAPQAAERRRRILLPDFERRFMARTEIRFRAAIYVDAETKRKILDVVRKIGSDRMTEPPMRTTFCGGTSKPTARRSIVCTTTGTPANCSDPAPQLRPARTDILENVGEGRPKTNDA